MRAVRGDTNVFDVNVVRQGSVVDLTNAKMWFTAKSDRSLDDDDAAIALNSDDNPTQVRFTDEENGRAQIVLAPEDTSALEDDAYYFDIQIVEDDGTITTIASDILHIEEDVTRAIV